MKSNIAKSISYLELVNNITSLVNNLLYSQENGYCNWGAKDAVLNFENVVKKFDSEVLKLTKNINYSDVENVIKTKKLNLIKEIQKHYESQIMLWADQVFDAYVDNSLFELSIHKTKSEEIYNQLIRAGNWLCEVKKISKDEQKAIFDDIALKFNDVLKSNDNDYLPLNAPKKSNADEFCALWDLILDDLEGFLSQNFSLYQTKLTTEDINYFENIKLRLLSSKKTLVQDEINLIASALDVAKINAFESKYNFIKQVNFDFIAFMEQHKMITEEDKIRLINRRVELFSDKSKKSKNYFKQLFTF